MRDRHVPISRRICKAVWLGGCDAYGKVPCMTAQSRASGRSNMPHLQVKGQGTKKDYMKFGTYAAIQYPALHAPNP